ncbi:hypothetical protein MTO96_027600 [Rhipicephalus appendiculatus]
MICGTTGGLQPVMLNSGPCPPATSPYNRGQCASPPTPPTTPQHVACGGGCHGSLPGGLDSCNLGARRTQLGGADRWHRLRTTATR